MFSVGDAFPALVRTWEPGPVVRGSLWRPDRRLTQEVLDLVVASLDSIESFFPDRPSESMYVREKMRVRLEDGSHEDAWVYVWNRQTTGMAVVWSGDWLEDRWIHKMRLF